MKTWNTITYVFQHVNPNGAWFDYSTWNTDPFRAIQRIKDDYRGEDDGTWKAFIESFELATPKDNPWRLIKRVAEETIIEGSLD
jgi:hypothetical protein